jgi:hypothetical protein
LYDAGPWMLMHVAFDNTHNSHDDGPLNKFRGDFSSILHDLL